VFIFLPKQNVQNKTKQNKTKENKTKEKKKKKKKKNMKSKFIFIVFLISTLNLPTECKAEEGKTHFLFYNNVYFHIAIVKAT
jgi:hypothetical protein